jgi:hypothetical protein
MLWAVKDILLFLIILSGIPAGMIISKYTEEEIKKGRLEIKILMIISGLIFLSSMLLSQEEGALIMAVSGFIFLLSYSSIASRKA